MRIKPRNGTHLNNIDRILPYTTVFPITGERTKYTLPRAAGILAYRNDPAYMDDLITPSATVDDLLQKADIISVYCIIFEVGVANWSSVELPIKPTLLIHRGGWVAQTIQLQVSTRQVSLALKYLGIQNILNNTSLTQEEILSKQTQRLVLRIATEIATATATTKPKVYNAYVLPRIGYPGQINPNIITKGRKDQTRQTSTEPSENMSSFPT